jgi:hypothetical protein
MNGLKTGVIAGLILAGCLASTAGAAIKVRYVAFSNQYAGGEVRVGDAEETGATVGTYAFIGPHGSGNQRVSVTNVKVQRRACGSHKWRTKAATPSRDGFHKERDADQTRQGLSYGGRGWWRGKATFAFKPRPGAPVKWRKTFTTPTLGSCHPVPPTP